jgi:hypothetical protein
MIQRGYSTPCYAPRGRNTLSVRRLGYGLYWIDSRGMLPEIIAGYLLTQIGGLSEENAND